MLLSTGQFFNGAGGGGSAPGGGEYAYVATAQNLASATTYTFTDMDIGAADTDRIVVATLYWGQVTSDRTLLSASIGGVAATIVAQRHVTTGGVAIIQAAVPAGTTGTVSFTLDGNGTRGKVSTYRLIPVTAAALDSGDTALTNPAAISDIQVADGGFLICHGFINNTNTLSPNYNGADTPVVDTDGIIESAHYVQTWSCGITEDATGNDPGFTASPTNGTMLLVAASWL